jgi:hypothetical protein
MNPLPATLEKAIEGTSRKGNGPPTFPPWQQDTRQRKTCWLIFSWDRQIHLNVDSPLGRQQKYRFGTERVMTAVNSATRGDVINHAI